MNIKKSVAAPQKVLFILTLILCALGLLFVFEASVAEAYSTFGNPFYFVRQQAMWLGIGMAGLIAGSLIPIPFWKKISPALYGLSILLLIATFLPVIGREVNGARRWLYLPGFSLQPVEVLKFAIVSFFAKWMTEHQKLGPFLFLTLLPSALLLKQPDMGSALIVLAIAFGMYFLAGAPLKTFTMIGGLGAVLLILIIYFSPYRLQRVTTFLNPEADPLGASFHIHQITLALGNGGLMGEGIGKSRQKFSYIPEASTDSIFAIVAEEIGFLGSVVLIALFAFFIRTIHQITKKTKPGTYEYLFSMGLLIWVGMQIVLNLSAIVALVPLTGIPLPFFSYGGTSLMMVLFVIGILIQLGRKGEA